MKEIQFELAFFKEGTFQSYYAACGWLEKNGYSYGSMCGHEPVALLKGDYSIAKWKNLSKEERRNVDGIMTGDFREGEVKITIYKKTEVPQGAKK